MTKACSERVPLASSAAKHPQLIESVGQHGQSSTLAGTYCTACPAFIRPAGAEGSIIAFGLTHGKFLYLCSDSFFKWATYRMKSLHDRSWLSGKGPPTTSCSVEEPREGSSRRYKDMHVHETKQQQQKKNTLIEFGGPEVLGKRRS